MPKMTKYFGLISAAALIGTPLALAGSPADYFAKMDADSSGVVSQSEYVAFKTAGGKYTAEKAAASFTKLAGDDAELTLAEMEKAMKVKSKRKSDCDKSKETAA